MALIVQKYGGTSVGSIERIQAVAQKIKAFADGGDQLVVSVSAMSGETNRMTALAQEIQDVPSLREMDMLLTTGEQVTISLLAMALQQLGCDAISYLGSQVRIVTDSEHGKARIKSIDDHRIHASLDAGKVVVVAGFQGIDEKGHITTLGRGGSDTTAVALAAALIADECQIYTDVDGVYTTDPRIVPEAKKLDSISIEEMLELAGQGAKVMQIRAVEFANKYKVLVRVLSSFEPGSGTLILQEEEGMEDAVITGIASQENQTKFTLHGVVDTPGIASGILSPISDAGIEVDVIVQNVSVSGKTDFTFTVGTSDRAEAETVLKEKMQGITYDELMIDEGIGKVSLVGVGMRSHAGIASTAFNALADAGINIQMISTSEIKITIVIADNQLKDAVKTLHAAFNLGS